MALLSNQNWPGTTKYHHRGQWVNRYSGQNCTVCNYWRGKPRTKHHAPKNKQINCKCTWCFMQYMKENPPIMEKIYTVITSYSNNSSSYTANSHHKTREVANEYALRYKNRYPGSIVTISATIAIVEELNQPEYIVKDI